MNKILIFSPSYNENSGGIIALHKLCQIINQLGREAYLFPAFSTYEINRNTSLSDLKMIFKSEIKSLLKFKTNPAFYTPVIYKKKHLGDLNDWIVIYPEIVFGNPLNSKNVVRWLLHNPGFHTKKIFYGENETYFKFNSAIRDFQYPGSTLSRHELKVIHYPLEHYNLDGASAHREGTAYCLRKGKNKKIQHDLKGSILIDGKSHAEVSRIFKKVKTFISYDTYTAYSFFAVLCGCESIVIPDEGVSEESWYPNPRDRYGLAYGFENLEKAKETSHLIFDHVISEENKSTDCVKKFIETIDIS